MSAPRLRCNEIEVKTVPHILKLDSHLANLIAAGEVVERPASVVKELVENSVDAGAKNITVELQNGGMTLLRITDDGCGMGPEDARLCFERHATSKLRRKEDLEAIGTLGFRGEALAATAAVSKVDLLTRTADSPEGVSLHLEAGKLLREEPAGCPVGTTILVRELFYNTPARMKFMKRDSVEASAAIGAVQRQALAHPEIAFRVIKDGEIQLRTAGDGDLMSAVYSVLGRQAAHEMIPVESRWEKLSVSGFVSRPTVTRGTRSNQHFYVNHRYIRSKTLTAALEEAYRNQLMTGRFPSCVLNITMPLSAVDVNVHPAKTEVKFLNEKEIFDCVHYGVLGALNKTPGQVPFQFQGAGSKDQGVGSKEQDAGSREQGAGTVGAAAPRDAREFSRPHDPDNRFFKAMSAEEYRKVAKPQVHTMTRWEYAQMTKALEKTKLPEASAALQQAVRPGTLNSSVALPTDETEGSAAAGTVIVRDAHELGRPDEATGNRQQAAEERGFFDSGLASAQDDKNGAPPADATLPLEGMEKAPAFRYIGEVFRTYILVEEGDELILIDKHAAHERINFERLLQQGTTVLGQTLLEPRTCRLDREEAALLTEHRDLLLSLGYDLEDFGEGDLLLRQIPSDIEASDAEAALSEIAGHLQNGRLDTPERLRDEALHTIACKAAIKAGYITDPVELRQLAATVLSRDDLKYCPHGRPICTVITKKQMEKQFKRIT